LRQRLGLIVFIKDFFRVVSPNKIRRSAQPSKIVLKLKLGILKPQVVGHTDSHSAMM